MNQTEYNDEKQKIKLALHELEERVKAIQVNFKAVRNQIDFLHDRLIKLEGTTVHADVKPEGKSYMYWPGEGEK